VVEELERSFFTLPSTLRTDLGNEKIEERLAPFGIRPPFMTLSSLPWRAGNAEETWWL
jgi:hypothetical protein